MGRISLKDERSGLYQVPLSSRFPSNGEIFEVLEEYLELDLFNRDVRIVRKNGSTREYDMNRKSISVVPDAVECKSVEGATFGAKVTDKYLDEQDGRTVMFVDIEIYQTE